MKWIEEGAKARRDPFLGYGHEFLWEQLVKSQWRHQDFSKVKHVEVVSRALDVVQTSGDFSTTRHLHEITDYQSIGLRRMPTYLKIDLI